MKTLQLLAVIVLLSATSASAIAESVVSGNTASVDASATAKVVEPITISNSQVMSFGVLTKGEGTINTVGETTGTVGVVGSTYQAAEFTVGGENGYTYTVNCPSTVILKDKNNSSNIMEAVLTPPTPMGSGFVVGTDTTLEVPGTLTVSSTNSAGDYEGSFTMTVEYE